MDQIYLRLGTIYLTEGYQNTISDEPVNWTTIAVNENSARVAKSMFLVACTIKGTSETWLGVGKSCLALKEYSEAEDALAVPCDLIRKPIF